MRTNVLKKLKTGNPLVNFHLWKELEEYNACKTDEELANFYHKMLNKFHDRGLIYRFILAMIAFSCQVDINQKTPTQL